MQKIAIDQDFTVPVERAFAYLSEHENLTALFPAVEKLRAFGAAASPAEQELLYDPELVAGS